MLPYLLHIKVLKLGKIILVQLRQIFTLPKNRLTYGIYLRNVNLKCGIVFSGR